MSVSNRNARVESLEGRQMFSIVVGLTPNNTLLTFDSNRPNLVLDRQKVTGLDSGDRLVGIDFLPTTGQLYGIGRGESVYTIDALSGVATKIGGGFALPNSDTAAYGVDFNPVVDRLRVANSDNQNFRVNQLTGAVVDNDLAQAGTQPDLSLVYNASDINAGVDARIAAAAYTNSFAGATSTTLYALDAATGSLVTIGGVNGVPSPNGGELNTVGSLGFNFADAAGLDIVTVNGVQVAYASVRLRGTLTRLYTIDLSTGAATLVGRLGIDQSVSGIAVMPGGQRMTALTVGNRLMTFDLQRPDIITSNLRVTGLAANEQLLGIDYRPATGELYAVGKTNRLYNVSADTGVATVVGNEFAQSIGDSVIGVDFNPVVDRLRVVTSTGTNLRLNQLTGALVDSDLITAGLQLDTPLSYADASTPAVSNVAYTQNFAGTTATTLYGIDFSKDILVTHGSVGGTPTSPNTGQLFAVGSLGVDVLGTGGFDIITTSGTDRAIAALRVKGSLGTKLYDIDLATGAATLISDVGKTFAQVRGIAARP